MLTQVYSDTIRGAMLFTGNTLGFSQSPSATTGINAFLSTNSALSVAGYPAPSTLNWQQNGSTAQLQIPSGSSIVHAELIWGGSAINNATSLPTATLNTPITFIDSQGITHTITYDPTTADQATASGQLFYSRSQDVTSIVQNAGIGTYTVNGVPSVLNPAPGQTASAGWVLAVVYSNPSLPYQNINLYTGIEGIANTNPPVDTTISGFATPSSGPLNARVLVSAMEGNPNLSGDSLSIGPNTSSLTTLFGPNNPANNFFDSTINNSLGLTDTTGSFGNLNQSPGTLLPGVRSAWDITNVNASSAFVNSQQQATVRLSTTGDTYAVSALGVEIEVAYANLSTTKTTDKTYADVGETITYTVVIPNNGTTTANNVIFTDSIPTGTSFINNSLTINGSQTSGVSPQSGVNIGSINAGASSTVTFKVISTATGTIVNGSSLSYSFVPAPGLTTINAGTISNQVTSVISTATISPTKTVNKSYADVGDTLTYTVSFTNNGNTNANNVVISDLIPNGTSLVSINSNVAFTQGTPVANIILTNPVTPGSTVTTTFAIKVNQVPNPNPIQNIANVSYTYTVIPTLPNGVSKLITTSTVPTQINSATITSVKSASPQTALVGDIITYTVTVTNTGNVSTTSAVFKDTIPSGTTYVSGSLTVDGAQNPSNPSTGVNISPIAPGQTKTISFNVVVNSNLVSLPISNSGYVDYTYIVDPSLPAKGVISTTNITTSNVSDISIVKSVDKPYAQVGDTVTYTNIITNTGNVTIANVVFTDTPPTGTTYVDPSLNINNILYPAINPNSQIDLGLQAPTIFPLAPGGTISVKYKVTIDTIPQNPIINNISTSSFSYVNGTQTSTSSKNSNESTVTVRQGYLELTKTSNATTVAVGDNITYTILAKNTGNVDIQNVIIYDTIPSQTSFVSGSVMVNGMENTQANPLTGINIGTIQSQQTSIITFIVNVVSLPSTGQILNSSSGSFQYLVDPNGSLTTSTSQSNTIPNGVEEVLVTLSKECTPSTIVVGDTITYNFTISNSGTVDISNITFFDTLPNGVSFVNSSFIGASQSPVVSQDLINGVTIGNLAVGTETIISFQGNVARRTCPPTLVNIGRINYNYSVVSGQTLVKTYSSNICSVELISQSFKQSFADGILSIPAQKPNIEDILDVKVTPVIKNSEIINSPIGVSQEGQVLTGKKLLTYIKLCIKVTYVSTLPSQSVHSANYEVSTCEHIVIPQNTNTDAICCMDPDLYIEDIYYEKLNGRDLFYNITYLVSSCF